MNLENLLQFFFREIMRKIPHTNNLELNMLKTKEKKNYPQNTLKLKIREE
jgi:hypothetical protein